MSPLQTYKWWDGVYLPQHQPIMDDEDHSLHYGDGVIDGECAYPELDEHNQPTGRWHILLGQRHGQRLVDGGQRLRINCPIPEPLVTQAAANLVALNRHPQAVRLYVRRLLTRGAGLGVKPKGCVPTISVRTKPWDAPYIDPASLINGGASGYLTTRRRFFPEQFPGEVKGTASYTLGTEMELEAEEAGASIGLSSDYQNHLLDSAGSNLFAVRQNDTVVYPDPDRSNILGGLTFYTLLRHCFRELGLTHGVSPISIEEVKRGYFKGGFFAGTAVEVTPWTVFMYRDANGDVQSVPLGKEVPEVVVAIRAWYTRFMHGQLAHLRGPEYLTPVPEEREIVDLRKRLEAARLRSAA